MQNTEYREIFMIRIWITSVQDYTDSDDDDDKPIKYTTDSGGKYFVTDVIWLSV